MGKKMTLTDLSYSQLENLIQYFHRNASLLHPTYTYTVTTHQRSLLDSSLRFNITFPASYVKELPVEMALEMILNGLHVPDSDN